MTGGALFPQAQDGSPRAATRSYKGTGLARLGPTWRAGASIFRKSYKKGLEKKRTSGEMEKCSDGTATGSGCARRGYKTFLRLLREFIEVTE